MLSYRVICGGLALKKSGSQDCSPIGGFSAGFLDVLGVSTPPVVFNGALVPSLAGGDPILCRPLPAQPVQVLVQEARKHGDYLELYTATGYYVERLGYEGEWQRRKLGIEPVVGPFPARWEIPLLKAQFVICTETQRQRLQALSRAIEAEAILSWGVSPDFRGYFVNVMRRGVEKASSLDVLLRELGIPWERVFAAGDSPSDLAYVQKAGCGVIMGNAPASVRDRAPHIVPSVDEDGLAQAIETFVLA